MSSRSRQTVAQRTDMLAAAAAATGNALIVVKRQRICVDNCGACFPWDMFKYVKVAMLLPFTGWTIT